MAQRSAKNIVWIDCEMTGLSAFLPDKTLSKAEREKWIPDRILEIAAIVTTPDLVPLDKGIELIIKTDKHILDSMNDWCIKQHGATGLTASCLASTTTMEDVDKLVTEYIAQHFPEGFEMALLAGNSIHADKAFISKDLPLLNSKLHYRLLDVSSIKELAIRLYPNLPRPSKNNSAHRAMSDIEDSINELKYYRTYMFKSPDEMSEPDSFPVLVRR